MPDLTRLREHLRERSRERKRQRRLYKKTGERGHARAAAAAGRAMRKLRGLIKKALALQPAIKRVRIRSTAAGRPHWGGAADVMGQFVTPFMSDKFGLPAGSKKRTPAHNAAIGGSPTSDHLTTKTTTFAVDYPTVNGEAAARALALAFGIKSWSANSFTTYTVTIDCHQFNVQILWGASIAHDDHVHVGISLVR